jgi:hypothetical protein
MEIIVDAQQTGQLCMKELKVLCFLLLLIGHSHKTASVKVLDPGANEITGKPIRVRALMRYRIHTL